MRSQRLKKEQHKLLEEEFLKANKPSTAYKRDLAALLGVPIEKINVCSHLPALFLPVLSGI
jgi:hypothetical protein